MNISINYHAVNVKVCLRNATVVTEEGHKEGLAEVERGKKNQGRHPTVTECHVVLFGVLSFEAAAAAFIL